MLSRVRFAADGTCRFEANTIKLMGSASADLAIKYGQTLSLSVACTDGSKRLHDASGKELVTKLPPIMLAKRYLRLDKLNGEQVNEDVQHTVRLGDKLQLEAVAISDSVAGTVRHWRKGIRSNVVGHVKIAYRYSDDSDHAGALTCGDTRKPLVAGRVIVDMTVPTEMGPYLVDKAFDLAVVLCGEMIDKHETTIRLKCLPPLSAPERLVIIREAEALLAGPSVEPILSSDASDVGSVAASDAPLDAMDAEAEATDAATPLAVRDGEPFGFTVQVLNGNNEAVSKTHYGWSLRVALAPIDPPLPEGMAEHSFSPPSVLM
eukprot:2225562-Prymnesium_polylepis.1